MKNQTTKKLFAFMLLVSGIFSLTVANAQIVYTDVNPDLTITQSSAGSAVHGLDINNDGIIDATMTAEWVNRLTPRYHEPYTIKEVRVGTSAGSQVLIDSLNTILIVAKVDSASQTWSSSQYAVLVSNVTVFNSTTYPSGAWSDTTDRFLAIRITIGGDWFYGWVRVSVSPDSISFTIRDYAYNSTPNQFILAGDTGTGTVGIIENVASSSINLFPNPADNHLTIALGSNNKKIQVTIADITGKIIYTTIARETQKIEVNTKDFATGVYLVQIQTGEFIETKKFVVEK